MHVEGSSVNGTRSFLLHRLMVPLVDVVLETCGHSANKTCMYLVDGQNDGVPSLGSRPKQCCFILSSKSPEGLCTETPSLVSCFDVPVKRVSLQLIGKEIF